MNDNNYHWLGQMINGRVLKPNQTKKEKFKIFSTVSKNVGKGVSKVPVLVGIVLPCVARKLWHFSAETSLKTTDSDPRPPQARNHRRHSHSPPSQNSGWIVIA